MGAFEVGRWRASTEKGFQDGLFLVKHEAAETPLPGGWLSWGPIGPGEYAAFIIPQGPLLEVIFQ